jgi:glutathione S-transferase
MRILHLTTAEEWAQAQRSGSYTVSTRGRTLEQEGYIHCSQPHQVEPVRQRYFDGVPDLVLLEVETDLLTAPWRTEQLAGMAEAFPHVYGPIDLVAVVEVRPVGSDVR